tara:strand:- start:852 stop:1541 length:690 start_codon:yes stop_codon:yes gene_type:complete
MAKRGGFGRFLGGIAGRPYDRLMNRLEKIAKEHSGSALANECEKFVKIVRRTLDEEQIDEEEHDLIMEEIEDIHPEGKTYPRLGDDSEDFYDGDDLPDAPELELGRRSNLDDLMKTKDGSFTGSFGRDEYEEYRQRMAEDFFKESDEAIASGDHQNMTSQDPGHRVFHDVEDEATDLKRQIAQEMGVEAEEEEDETYRVDEDGTEWWQDDDGAWWYRPKGEEDWFPYDE